MVQKTINEAISGIMSDLKCTRERLSESIAVQEKEVAGFKDFYESENRSLIRKREKLYKISSAMLALQGTVCDKEVCPTCSKQEDRQPESPMGDA